MGKWLKRIVFGSIAAIGIGGLWKLTQLARRVVVESGITLESWGIWGARIAARPKIKNPTNKEIEITYPFVTVDLGKDKDIASSDPSPITLIIPANGTLDWNAPDPKLYPDGLPAIELRITAGSVVDVISRLIMIPFTGVPVPEIDRTLTTRTHTRMVTATGEIALPIPSEKIVIG
jgi:hypothetical protein